MSETQLGTAVAFFIFNRPDTTQRVFDAIRKAKPKQLFVITVAPRNNIPGEAEKCAEARKIIDTIDWNCEIYKNYSDKHLNIEVGFTRGMKWVFEHVETAIILEDDCVPDSSFFTFCNIMLDKYKDDTRIMMISGTNLLFKDDFIEETYYFSQFFSIWGWATWKRAWTHYDGTMSKWPEFKKKKMLESIYQNKLFIKYFEMCFDRVFEENGDDWDYKWFFTGLCNRGLSIIPAKNLISNIGIDGTHLQDVKYLNRATSSINLDFIKDPKFLAIDPRIEDKEIKILLKNVRFSYFKYFIIKLLKFLHLFDRIEKLYLKYKS